MPALRFAAVHLAIVRGAAHGVEMETREAAP